MRSSITVRFDQNVQVPMRDGTNTYADVYRPSGSGKHPVLMTRTPYDKSSAASRTNNIDAVTAASHGYAVVIQDVRGRYTSEGDFYTFQNEINDGFDSIEWAGSQGWSSGKVGMYGSSYVGATQWLAAKSKPPSKGLSPSQRRKMAIRMRIMAKKPSFIMKRQRAMKRAATKAKLLMRARKSAIKMVVKKFYPKLRGKQTSDLSYGERGKISKIVKQKATLITRFAKRMVKDKRKQDIERRKSMNKPKEK